MPVEKSLLEKVELALEGIRPYLITDGGDVRILDITPENVVKLELLGACGTCPMSSMTLRAGVEESIRRAVPEVDGRPGDHLCPAWMVAPPSPRRIGLEARSRPGLDAPRARGAGARWHACLPGLHVRGAADIRAAHVPGNAADQRP